MYTESITDKIKALIESIGITNAEAARRLNMTPQNFSNKISRNRWLKSDLINIEKAFDVEIICDYKIRLKSTGKEF